MANKQTALDWLINEIWGIEEPPLGIKLYYETAKEMEKEQITKAYNSAIPFKFGEEYYNETYGK